MDEIGFLQAYLDGGGKVLLTTDAYYSTPRLDAVIGRVRPGPGGRAGGWKGTPATACTATAITCWPDYAASSGSTALDGLDLTAPVLLQMAQGIAITPPTASPPGRC